VLYTGQRGSDVVKMVRNDIVNGCIRVSQKKARKGTINEQMIPIHPALARALQAGPVVGMHHLPRRRQSRVPEVQNEMSGRQPVHSIRVPLVWRRITYTSLRRDCFSTSRIWQ
jgi:hypothetical protein